MDQQNGKNSSNLTQLVLTVVLVAAAFFIGMLWTKVNMLESGGVVNKQANNVANQPSAQPTAQPIRTAKDLDPVSETDRVKGNRSARFALVEYSDIDCPFCIRFHPTAEQMLTEYGDKVMWVYRHFPIDGLHPNARKKAEAAECAYKLGGNDKFWKFLDEVVTTTNRSVDELTNIASKAGLNSVAFKSCVDNGETKSVVQAFEQSGEKAGVTGTPGNILLDTKTGETVVLPGAVPFDKVKTALDALMAKAK